jgi:hypothetical protein
MGRLLDFYDDEEYEAVLLEAITICMLQQELDLDDVFQILEETQDPDIATAMLDILSAVLPDNNDELINIRYKNVSHTLQEYILIVLAQAERSKYMQFLLDQYFHDYTKRPVIRATAFKHHHIMFLNLARYIESVKITAEIVEVTQQILGFIPKEHVIPHLGIFAGTKLLDIYYAMERNG